MRQSALDLFPSFYDDRQVASGAIHIAHLDMRLIEDGTYFVHEADGELVACGGWSRRAKLYTAPAQQTMTSDCSTRRASPLAFGRCSSVGTGRRGIGRAILEACERAARSEGFQDLVLMATLPGEPLYRAFGFREVERVDIRMPDGVTTSGVLMERPITPEGG